MLLYRLMIVAGLIWQTTRCESAWRSSLALWDHAAAMAPAKPRVLLNAGIAHLAIGDAGGACPLLLRAERDAHQSEAWAENIQVAASLDLYALRLTSPCP